MELITDITLYTDNKRTKKYSGDIYIKILDAAELLEVRPLVGTGEIKDQAKMIQISLVDEKGDLIFKPQQVAVVSKRLSGVDFECLCIDVLRLNDFSKISRRMEEYSKNLESNQNTD